MRWPLDVWQTISVTISVCALFTGVSGYWLSWHQFQLANQNVEIVRTNIDPDIKILIDKGHLKMQVTNHLYVVNLSTASSSIFNVRCDSIKRLPIGGDWEQMESCKAFAVNGDKEVLAIGNVPIEQKQTVLIKLVSSWSPNREIEEIFRQSTDSANHFDDEKFLLYLADQGRDFFGNSLSIQHHYLQKTFGKNLCLGASIKFSADIPGGRTIVDTTDYYVGRMAPAVECDSKYPHVINWSGPYRRDLFTASEPL